MNIKKLVIYALFAAYAVLALNLLFFMRDSMWRFYTYKEYFPRNTNFVPFRTVIEFAGYIRSHDKVYGDMSADNLLGNLAVFMPAGIIFPAVWKRQRSFRRFMLTVSAVIIGVELIQLLTMCGSCDIDDYILNISGALLGFALSGLKPVQRLTYTDAGHEKGE